MLKRLLLCLGLLLALPVLLLLGVILYGEAGAAVDALQHRFLPPARVTITWPSNWGCDEFQEAYTVVKIEYPSSLVRRLFKGTTLLVPYPSGHYGDTTAFHRYYSRRVKHGSQDTVVVRGRFGYDIGVGERGVLYQCEDIPYFDVSAVYSTQGKLLKRFSP
ncbi:hypothetical protein [Hymenobacter cellulosivorans]|uniref:Uncharacterized protein n=1 Tax=Hymenobacter cellulosivorans TaxID=2932249 RepID=A0ABY4FBC9_9BACT|nr:hypothetical protein [Hymenobacter cellulosivorans]UOQ53980.1 hypothetical protein MUN80_04270 [Hymenobacter cellulosivorans]